jgi:hypothetical protein
MILNGYGLSQVFKQVEPTFTVILRARFRKFGHVLFSTESLSPVRCHGGTGLRAGHEPVAGRDAGPTDPLG